MRAASDARLLLFLAPWPGEGHPEPALASGAMDPSRKRKLRLVVALTAAVLLAAALIYTSFSASTEASKPQRDPAGALVRADRQGREGLDRATPATTCASASATATGPSRCPVDYTGVVPDPFREGREVIVVGRAAERHVRRRARLARHEVPVEVHEGRAVRAEMAGVGSACLVVALLTAALRGRRVALRRAQRPPRVGRLGRGARSTASPALLRRRVRRARGGLPALRLLVRAGRRGLLDRHADLLQGHRHVGDPGRLAAAVGRRCCRSSRPRCCSSRAAPCATSRPTPPRCSACIAAFFLLLMVGWENPFDTLAAPPAEGAGLNPLLRHPAMMIHPPMLYTGYVGFSIPFAFAIGALVARRTGADWIRATRRFALIAWTFLGTGHHARRAVVLHRARLGRLLGLGPGRERLADAVARRHRVPPLDHGPGEARDAEGLERVADLRHVHARAARHVPRALRASSTRSTPSAPPRSACSS